MPRTVSLRKCGTHDDCQLESVNGGPWGHTPQDRTVAARFLGVPATSEEVNRGIPDSELVPRLDNLEALTERTVEEMAHFGPDSRAAARDLPKFLTRAESMERRLNELVSRAESKVETTDRLKALNEAVLRAQASADGGVAALSAYKLDAEGAYAKLTAEVAQLWAHVDTLRAEVADLKARVSTLFASADSLMQRIESRAAELDKLDLRPIVMKLERELAHERAERIENHRKVMRSFRTIGARTET